MVFLQVLWGLGLLSVLAVSLLSSGTASYRLARNSLETVQFDAAMDAAVNRAVLALLDPRPDKRWRVDGIGQSFEFEGISIKVSMQDELGRLDLNHVDALALQRLLVSARLDATAASKLVDKILDWRERSDTHRLNGAKARDYKLAGLNYVPRNGPFQSVSELRLVMDMTEDLFQRIRPALTVYSGSQFVDPQFAPAEALSAIPTMTAQTIAATIAARARPGAGTIPTIVPLRGRAFSLHIQVRDAAAREAVVRLTDDPKQPYWNLHRQR
jgi:general secretion pathway protein K